LTAELAANGQRRDGEVWVLYVRAPAMMTALATGFEQMGIPAGRIRWEQFSVR
jgi:hypothetical protein